MKIKLFFIAISAATLGYQNAHATDVYCVDLQQQQWQQTVDQSGNPVKVQQTAQTGEVNQKQQTYVQIPIQQYHQISQHCQPGQFPQPVNQQSGLPEDLFLLELLSGQTILAPGQTQQHGQRVIYRDFQMVISLQVNPGRHNRVAADINDRQAREISRQLYEINYNLEKVLKTVSEIDYTQQDMVNQLSDIEHQLQNN
ncbi:hypothetical protein H0A36_26025 [Endozoicomonas sp. SM1973]|uniref:Uncharacterized protein n=1 Tax=Spartinivicinus marinus TaxID=2994442 RepID=A0A853I9C4_9GAMM|nr:hypothetical protein [Spartinivicinus marinus]MCX4024621.1 hypothetical protein [Spartinivicinus marinus]NYZ69479.1 hypothetical protein [Spartinivicinus marinus]